MKKNILIAILFLIILSVIMSLPKSVLAQNDIKKSQISTTPISPSNELDRIEILEEKLEIISEYNDRLMSTLQWSLGTMITVFLVIFGLNWFINYRQYRTDIENFKDSVINSLSTETKKITAKMNQDFGRKNKKFETHSEQIIEEQITQLNKKIEGYFQNERRNNNSKFNSIDQELTSCKLQDLKTQAEIWKMQGVYANAISRYVDMINLDPNHATIEFTLSNLEKAIIKYDRKLEDITVQNIEDAIKKVKDRNKTLSERIIKLINK